MASNITTLVEKAKLGDADAFSTLYQMYYPKMKGICINILREDKAVVDDLVQDAFVLAFVSLKDLKILIGLVNGLQVSPLTLS